MRVVFIPALLEQTLHSPIVESSLKPESLQNRKKAPGPIRPVSPEDQTHAKKRSQKPRAKTFAL